MTVQPTYGTERIKTFIQDLPRSNFCDLLDRQVNHWLADNPKIKILDRKTAMTSGDSISCSVIVVTIFYHTTTEEL